MLNLLLADENGEIFSYDTGYMLKNEQVQQFYDKMREIIIESKDVYNESWRKKRLEKLGRNPALEPYVNSLKATPEESLYSFALMGNWVECLTYYAFDQKDLNVEKYREVIGDGVDIEKIYTSINAGKELPIAKAYARFLK